MLDDAVGFFPGTPRKEKRLKMLAKQQAEQEQTRDD